MTGQPTPGGNPFLTPSPLPYELPPFADIRTEHFREAFEAGMAEKRAEVQAVAGCTEPPTFANTLVPLERSGGILDRATRVFYLLTSADTSPELERLENEYAAVFAAFDDEIMLDRRLFARIDELYARRDELDLDAEEQRLVERYHADFVRSGAGLSEPDQQRLAALNSELAQLCTAFGNNLLADTNDSALHLTDPAELDGLAEDAVAAAREAAAARGLDGYLLTLVLPTHQPALEVLRDRDVRRRLYRASVARGARGNEHDNRATLRRIVAARAERAALLGYPTHSDYVLDDRMAKTNAAVDAVLGQLVPPAAANARQEGEELAAALRADTGDDDFAAWDWAYYAARLTRERFAMDSAALRPYFELDRVLTEGVFYAAERLYGISFAPRPDLAAYHPDARVFEVFDTDGSGLGLFVGDYFTRDSKRGGAWMEAVVRQSGLLGQRPVVVNNLNIPKPPPGRPALLTVDEVDTMFHEFGHALHGLFSAVRFPRLAGTSVARDFVEYPSQVNEMWMRWPEVLAHYARHHETGEPLAPEVIDRLRASAGFHQGAPTVSFLAAACLDLAWHRLSSEQAAALPADLAEVERAALVAAGIAVEGVTPRYLSSYFNHIFSGGYASGYYSYVWSEVLDADTVAWFTERGGLVRESGDRFRSALLSRGGTAPENDYVRDVLGRDARIEPLLARRGLA